MVFSLATPASKVTIGLSYTCKLQTLAIDTGDGAIKASSALISIDMKVKDALNLWAGSSFNRLVQIKDLVIGNVSSMLAGSRCSSHHWAGPLAMPKSLLDPTYTVPGQVCIQQNDPVPATILGLFTTIELEGGR